MRFTIYLSQLIAAENSLCTAAVVLKAAFDHNFRTIWRQRGIEICIEPGSLFNFPCNLNIHGCAFMDGN